MLNSQPTHPGGYSQWQSQTVARREGKCLAPANNQFYIHDNSHGDIPKERPRNIQNLGHTILPTHKNSTSDLVLHYSSQILECKQKYRIEPLRYRLVASPRVINDVFPPKMSKEPKQKTNRHADSTRIARVVKPNRVYEPVFQRKRKEVVSAIDLKQDHFGSVYQKER